MKRVALAGAIALGALPPPTALARGPAFALQGFPPGMEETILRRAGDAHGVAAAWFGTGLEGRVTVRWVTEPEAMRRHGVGRPETVAGLAVPDSNLVVLYAPALAAGSSRLGSVLLHELCHLFFAQATAGAEVLPPRWLNEGIAMRISGDWDLGLRWRANQDALLRDALAAGSVMPFEELDASFPDGAFFPLAYAQSLSFVEWMVRRKGDEGLRELLRLLDQDLDPEPAFERVYGIPIAEAAGRWRESVTGGGWLGRLPSARTLVGLLWIAVGLLMVAKYVRTRIQLRRARDEEAFGWSEPWRHTSEGHSRGDQDDDRR